MKYLKKYNESSPKEIMNTIEDICIDLEDMGYQIHIISGTIWIKKENGTIFNSKEIVDTVLRIERYLQSEGLVMKSMTITNSAKTNLMQNFKEFMRWLNYGIINTKSVSFKTGQDIEWVYNESVNVNIEEVSDMIKDILLELGDEDYYTNQIETSNLMGVIIQKDNGFKTKDIVEILLRINSYLESVGYYIDDVYYSEDSTNYENNKFIEYINLVNKGEIISLVDLYLDIKKLTVTK